MIEGLHWERGYRCWGLWTEDGKRVAAVGLGPPGHRRVVTWAIDGTDIKGDARSVKADKRAVEEMLETLEEIHGG